MENQEKKYLLEYYYQEVLSGVQKERFAEMVKKRCADLTALDGAEEKASRYQSFISRHCKIALTDNAAISTDDLLFYWRALLAVFTLNPATQALQISPMELINERLLAA